MLTASYRPRARTVWNPLRTSKEICRLGEGHSLCPWECRLSVGKTFPAKTTKMLSTRNSSILIMSSSVYLFFASECYFTKWGPSRPKTKYLYLRFPFLWRKEFRIIVASLLLSFWCGMVVKRVEKSKDLMFVIRLKFGDLRWSNNSFVFLRIHIWLTPLLE